MKKLMVCFTLMMYGLVGLSQENKSLDFAEDLFYNYRMNYDYSEYRDSLARLSFEQLQNDLNTDDKKMVFWLNIYNVFAQIHLENNPEDYAKRFKFFSDKIVVIAGESFSLNQIEHGILRHSKAVWGRGLVPKIFPKKREKQLRVDTPDARIHFALNCGAKSCPPINYYELRNINEQLDKSAKRFLETSSNFSKADNVVYVSKILSWYRKDFGGKKGILRWLKKYSIIPTDELPKVKFKAYDWSPAPKDYSK